MQGGGHSPATHDFRLGADQVLEAQVVLASGKITTVSACENPDLFFAIRGGSPSTYGIVVSTIIKAYHTTKVVAQILGFAPLTYNNADAFMSALAVIPQAYPDLSDSGFSGYGSWAIHSPIPILANYSTSFIHTIANFGKTTAEAKPLFVSTTAKLSKYSGSLFMTTTYYEFSTYVDYYNRISDVVSPVGQDAVVGSQLLGREAHKKRYRSEEYNEDPRWHS